MQSLCSLVSLCAAHWIWTRESKKSCLRKSKRKWYTSMSNIIKMFKDQGSVANLPRHGCKRKLNRNMVQMVAKDPRKCTKIYQLHSQVKVHWFNWSMISPPVTFWATVFLKEEDPGGLHCWSKKKMKMHIDKPPCFWKNVIWTDEAELMSLDKMLPFYINR